MVFSLIIRILIQWKRLPALASWVHTNLEDCLTQSALFAKAYEIILINYSL